MPKSDLEIAQAAKMKPVSEIAAGLGLKEEEYDLYGNFKAKISLDVLKRLSGRANGKYIDITATTPTPLGEGKTVINIGLTQALAKIGKNAISTLRQPSMGPVFGIKGGAAGAGYSQVVPMEDINLHFTGDIHAVGVANNLLAAALENQLFHPLFPRENTLGIDPASISWKRVVDLSDAALANIRIGTESGSTPAGYPRSSGFDITVASEVMAILALANDLQDMRKMFGRIIVGMDGRGQPVTAEQLRVAGAMAAVMKEAVKPNLVQTLENVPCIMHAGPFANIAIGNNSVLADRIALKLADYVVTESGFAADCGAEKFFDIKCRHSGLRPDCVVLNTTVRSLKMHGGAYGFEPGHTPSGDDMFAPDSEALRRGCANLAVHIENMKKFGVPTVVCINRFAQDIDSEVEIIVDEARKAGAESCVPVTVHADGGAGGIALAKAVVSACEQPSDFRFLYEEDLPVEEKIRTIAREIYRARDIELSSLARGKLARFKKWGLGHLPVCMAKTQLSISHDPALKGAPSGYLFPVRDVEVSAGAGYLYPLAGDVRTMPGMPSHPNSENIDIDEEGNVTGLF